MSKVKVSMNYFDKELGFYKNKGEVFEVTEERAEQLVAAEVVTVVKEKEPKNPESKDDGEKDDKKESK